jgi:hypothetical protein
MGTPDASGWKEYANGVRRPVRGTARQDTQAKPTEPVHPVVEALAALDKAGLAKRAAAEAARPVLEVVAAIDALPIFGDIVPMEWVPALARPGKRRTVGDFVTAHLLGHVVGWHHYKRVLKDSKWVPEKKFKGERLVIRRRTVASQLGCHVSSITRALRRLESLGLIYTKVDERTLLVTPVPGALKGLLCDLQKGKVSGNGSPSTPGVLPSQVGSVSHAANASPAASTPKLDGHHPLAEQLPPPSPAASTTIAAQLTPASPSASPSQYVEDDPTTTNPGTGAVRKVGGGGSSPSEVSPPATKGLTPLGTPMHDSEGQDIGHDRGGGDEGHIPAEDRDRHTGDQTGDEHQSGEATQEEKQSWAEYLAKHWSRVMTALVGKTVVFPEEAKALALEFLEANTDWNTMDIILVCCEAYIAAKDAPGDDNLFNCQRYATSPRKMFLLNADNKFPIVRMGEELGYDFVDDVDSFKARVNEGLGRLGKPPIYKHVAQAKEPEKRKYADPVMVVRVDPRTQIAKEYRRVMGGLGLDLALGQDALQAAFSYLEHAPNLDNRDVALVCALGAVTAVEHPHTGTPETDPYRFSRNFSLSPKEIFTHNPSKDLRFAKVQLELSYDDMAYCAKHHLLKDLNARIHAGDLTAPLKELAKWQEQEAEKRRRDPRRNDPHHMFECI